MCLLLCLVSLSGLCIYMEVNFLVTIIVTDVSSRLQQLPANKFTFREPFSLRRCTKSSRNKLKFDVFDRNQAPSAVLLKGLLPVLYLLCRVQKVKGQGHRSKNRSALLAMS